MKLLLAISLAFVLAGCGGPERHPQAASIAAPIAVNTVAAVPVDWPDTYEATGAVRARTAATLSSKVMAYVQQVSISVGDRVREGQVLVTLDARELESNVRR